MPSTTDELIKLAADCIVIHGSGRERAVLLIQRAHEPYAGQWAIPGGHVDAGEDADVAAARELAEEAGVVVDHADLVEVRAYHAPNRDPRRRVVSIAYAVHLSGPRPVPVAADDAQAAEWVPVAELGQRALAFDHATILGDALRQEAQT